MLNIGASLLERLRNQSLKAEARGISTWYVGSQEQEFVGLQCLFALWSLRSLLQDQAPHGNPLMETHPRAQILESSATDTYIK